MLHWNGYTERMGEEVSDGRYTGQLEEIWIKPRSG